MVHQAISVYNGYDYFDNFISKKHIGINLSELVLTRELQVTHKVKISKGARKNQMLKLKKKIPGDKKTIAKKKSSSKQMSKKNNGAFS